MKAGAGLAFDFSRVLEEIRMKVSAGKTCIKVFTKVKQSLRLLIVNRSLLMMHFFHSHLHRSTKNCAIYIW